MAGMYQIITISLAVGLASLGCTGTRSNWVGTWTGENPELVKPGMTDDIANTLRRVTLELRPDGTFDLVQAGVPFSGNVSYGDDRCFLKITTMFERRIDAMGPNAAEANKEIRVERQPDGSVLLVDPTSFHDSPIKLTRKAQPSEPGPR